MKKFNLMVGLLSLVAVMSACNKESDQYAFDKVKNDTFEHLHGLGYINGGPEFVIATHDGLYEYGKDGWKEANSEKHDYMGFQAIREGFFSSGHPAPKSDYKNPLGLIKSLDGGASFDKLAFYGEIDFHYMAAGYDSNAIYVLNEMPTKDMANGLHYSLDEGETWVKPAMNGFQTDFISNLAAHPTRKEMIAIGSKDGIFLSEDYGENFRLLNDAKMVINLTLTETGGYYSSYDNEIVQLKSFTFASEQEKDIQLPNEEMSPIIFIAVNPDDQKEIAIGTYTNDIYVTKDVGLNWNVLAENGKLEK